MPKISDEKIEKISEQILSYLYEVFPRMVFTVEVARETARDEEFTKKLLFGLQEKGLVVGVNKNAKGEVYSRRIRWRLSNKAHGIYTKA